MPANPVTKTLIAKIRRAAKNAARDGVCTHTEGLDRGARAAGFNDWRTLIATDGGSIPVDPSLPRDFDARPNDRRSLKQLDEWWDRPFAVTNANGTYTVRCLDGGAWDRSTALGIAPDLASANRLAIEKCAAWRAIRARPLIQIDYDFPDTPFAVVRQPQRPDQDVAVLARYPTAEAAAAALKAFD